MAATIKIEGILPPASAMPAAQFAKVDKAIELVLRSQAKEELKSQMQKRVRGWSYPPQFVGRYSKAGRDSAGTMYVFPRDVGLGGGQASGRDKWIWASQGTKTRSIVPSGGGRMFIRGGVGGYTPHTRAGNVYGGPGSYAKGGYWTKMVKSHSIKARNFEEHIKQESESKIVAAVQMAIQGAL